MKRLILIVLASTVLAGAQAQSVIPDALGGALVGTVIGGIAGGNCHNQFSGNGAAIGAGIGLAAGTLLGLAKQQTSYPAQPSVYYPAPVAYVQPGYGYAYVPAYATAPVYAAPPPRLNDAVGGTLVGAAPARPAPQVYRPDYRPANVHQVADAPRVPDAPTF